MRDPTPHGQGERKEGEALDTPGVDGSSMYPIWGQAHPIVLWQPLARLAISLAQVQTFFPGIDVPRAPARIEDWLVAYS